MNRIRIHEQTDEWIKPIAVSISLKNCSELLIRESDLTFQPKKAGENNHSEPEQTEKKSLPDLDKYWKAVNDDPTDFTAWTYLLQYVDQEVCQLH